MSFSTDPSSPIANISHKTKLCSPLTASGTKKGALKHTYNTKPPLNNIGRTKCPSVEGTIEKKVAASKSGMKFNVTFFLALVLLDV